MKIPTFMILPMFITYSLSYQVCASGMISSITTYTIAPAANAKAYGSIGFIIPTNNAPSTPAIGSTNPLSCPYLK